jgi:peptidyl-prolyl cis-trans isomerase B (cyclophilin B)
MVQGGGLLPGLKEKPVQPAIKNEASNKLKNTIGTLAMARTSEVDSATCQFFINVNDNDFLNHQNNSAQGYGYAVFGKVLEGMDFINLLKRQPTHTVYYYSDVPVHNIIIKKTTKL